MIGGVQSSSLASLISADMLSIAMMKEENCFRLCFLIRQVLYCSKNLFPSIYKGARALLHRGIDLQSEGPSSKSLMLHFDCAPWCCGDEAWYCASYYHQKGLLPVRSHDKQPHIEIVK